MKSVAILLSTYNGQQYLREQLDSLLAQNGVDVQIIVRDDGSSDDTIAILKEYKTSHQNITLLLESNIGCEPSFEKLTKYASINTNCDYYAYCDQDDVWFSDKMSTAISSMKFETGPCMYCCNQMITDGHLQPIQLMIREDSYDDTVKRLENNYFLNRHGCSMVWNRPLQDILGKIRHDKSIVPGHDGWAMLVARCAGKVIIGKEPLMYYRVHGGNTGGFERNPIKRLKKGYRLYLKNDCHRYDYANDCLWLLDKYKKNDKGAKYVKKVSQYKNSFFCLLKVLFSKQIWEYGKADRFIYALSVIMKKY